MFHIAICDDMPDQLSLLAGLAIEYVDRNQIDAEIHTFSHPDETLKMAEVSRFHIYILDIVMPMLSGVQLGIELRRLDREAQIIYATTAPEYALSSFAANPIGYLVKPIEKEKFFEIFALALSKVNNTEESTIAVKTNNGLRVLNASQILYCERLKNNIRVTLTTGEMVDSLSIRTAFSDVIAPLLKDCRFLQTHVSYAVNMSRVERVTDNEFIMRGGAVVPVSSKTAAATRKIYMDYIFKKGTN